jgi:hypothetical protein
LPQSTTFATGGSAFGDISTKSTFASAAIFNASLLLRIPSWSPLGPITRRCCARIASLMRIDVLMLSPCKYHDVLSVYSSIILSDIGNHFKGLRTSVLECLADM